jgi:hypothetical protein
MVLIKSALTAPARRLEPRCLREFVIVDSGL